CLPCLPRSRLRAVWHSELRCGGNTRGLPTHRWRRPLETPAEAGVVSHGSPSHMELRPRRATMCARCRASAPHYSFGTTVLCSGETALRTDRAAIDGVATSRLPDVALHQRTLVARPIFSVVAMATVPALAP